MVGNLFQTDIPADYFMKARMCTRYKFYIIRLLTKILKIKPFNFADALKPWSLSYNECKSCGHQHHYSLDENPCPVYTALLCI